MEQQVPRADDKMSENRPKQRNSMNVQQLPCMSEPPLRPVPALGYMQFYSMHKAFLDRNPLPPDRRQPTIPVDLYILHTEMMKVGGFQNVSFLASFLFDFDQFSRI